DCILKFGSDTTLPMTVGNNSKVGSANSLFESVRDNIILNGVLPKALKEKDFDSTEYALKHIEDDALRGTGILQMAAKYLEIGNKAQAYETMHEALKLLEKGDESIDRI